MSGQNLDCDEEYECDYEIDENDELKSNEDDALDDGMSDADFSNDDDEEYLEARRMIRDYKRKEICVDNDDQDDGSERFMDISILLEPSIDEGEESQNELDVDILEEPPDVDSDGSFEIIEDEQTEHTVERKLYSNTIAPKDLDLEIGLMFKDSKECQQVVRDWAIGNGFNIKWKKSSGGKLQAICRDGCPWKFYASKISGGEPTCVIRTLSREPHNCLFSRQNRQANARWLANYFLPKLKKNPNLSVKEMMDDIYYTHELVVNPMICYRAKAVAAGALRGTFFEHYAKLGPYVAELKRSDKEGKFELKTHLDAKGRPVFERIYIGFSALRKGFLIGCRRFIGFDACFLKTVLGGALLAAVSKDCNNKMYPIAWAVVEKETEDTWSWFFEHLFSDLNISDGLGWTFMSDKQKGLINGIAALAPYGEHRHCARHIYANWKKQFRGPKFKCLFWEIVRATSNTQYLWSFNKLKTESAEAADHFMSKGPATFCKSLINSFTKSDSVDNNISESFNAYILKARDKPLIDMLEQIRRSLMSKLHNFSISVESLTDDLCPNIQKKMTKINKLVRHCYVTPGAEGKYEVQINDDTYIVDLLGMECSCRAWELTGIPCCHALSCIYHKRDNPVRYTDPFYLKSNLVKCYKHGINPLHGYKDWPLLDHPPILPPNYTRPPGRPKKCRKRGADEISNRSTTKLSQRGMRMSCRNCGGFDHNRRTCKNPANLNLKKPASAPSRRTKGPNLNTSAPSSSTASAPLRRTKGPNSNTSARSSTATASVIPSKPDARMMRKEKRQANQGNGVFVAESGNIYLKAPGSRKKHFVSGSHAGTASRPPPKSRSRHNQSTNEEGSSQASQVF